MKEQEPRRGLIERVKMRWSQLDPDNRRFLKGFVIVVAIGAVLALSWEFISEQMYRPMEAVPEQTNTITTRHFGEVIVTSTAPTEASETTSSSRREPTQENRSGTAEIRVFDVGEADAIAVRLNDKVMLVDTGSWEDASSLVAKLDALAIDRVDILVLTHFDPSHIGGTRDILKHLAVGQVFLPEYHSEDAPSDDMYKESMNALVAADVNITPAEALTYIYDEDGVSVQIISNPRLGHTTEEPANYSICLRVEAPHESFLLMGDAGTEQKEWILQNVPVLDADYMKVSNHGSSQSFSEDFLARTGVKEMLISVGKSNNHNHPHATVLDAAERQNVRVRRTDHEGDLAAGHRLWP